MNEASESSPTKAREEAEGADSVAYLQEHEQHVARVVARATCLLQEAKAPEGLAGVLAELLQELYRHEDRLRRLQEAGLVGGGLRRQPSLVPVSSFLNVYLNRPAPPLALSCRALQPFAARAATCPVFHYVLERLGLLEAPPPGAPQELLASHLRHLQAVLGGPPGPDAGPLAALHARLLQQYAACLARRRYRVSLEACKPLRLAGRVVAWLEDTHAAALRDLQDAGLALGVLRRAAAGLQAAAPPRGEHLAHVLAAAMALLEVSLAHVHSAHAATPAAPPQAPRPLVTPETQFFPHEFLRACSVRVLARQEAAPLVVQRYLRLVGGLAWACGEVPGGAVPDTHVDTLLACLSGQDDSTLLQCLLEALRPLRGGAVPQAVRGVCLAVRDAAVSTVRVAWARQQPDEALDEERPLLGAARQVQALAALADTHGASPCLEEAVQEAYGKVRAAFIAYLRRAAARLRDPHSRRYVLLKNLLLLGPYQEAEAHLGLHDDPHTPETP